MKNNPDKVRKNPRDIGVPLGPTDAPLGIYPRPKPNAGGVMGSPVKPKGGGAMGMKKGGMAMEKGYAEGGMPMVMKDGKKVPSFAADGKGKMAMGGMATKMAMKEGGMATKNKDAAMKHGGMAHGTKAKKGRGIAIMIAIGKPKGRGK